MYILAFPHTCQVFGKKSLHDICAGSCISIFGYNSISYTIFTLLSLQPSFSRKYLYHICSSKEISSSVYTFTPRALSISASTPSPSRNFPENVPS